MPFLPQLLLVGLLVAFHVVVARRLLRIVVGGDRRRRARMRAVLLIAVAIIDAPLAHSFLLYKHYSPELIDTVMSSVSSAFLALHLTVLVFGLGLLVRDFVVRPIRLRTIRRERRARGARLARLAERIPAESRLMAPARAGLERLSTRRAESEPRRRFIRTAALAATGYVASASSLSAMRSEESRVDVVKIRIPNLPPALRGTTIALISDIHSSVYMPRDEMERYRKTVNDLKADVIVVDGDFINSKLGEVYPFAEAFSGMSAPLGVYGVTGNHDYYPRDIETVCREVEQAGIKLLRNENITLEKNGEKIHLLGMDDPHIYEINGYLESGKTETGRIENLMKGVDEAGTSIFLCHKPYPFEEYSQLGIDLMLSGHTHGGQIVLAQLDNINLSFASLASRYVQGLYRARSNQRSQLYVTRGVGTVGVPVRVNCPPEVTHIVLV
ncbi:MAG TPA: metallophosphoesterase [Candidatus Kapabacteria bacterium]|nr:metallophosphoesterase [Candidatus Kapabacteria bacterium]